MIVVIRFIRYSTVWSQRIQWIFRFPARFYYNNQLFCAAATLSSSAIEIPDRHTHLGSTFTSSGSCSYYLCCIKKCSFNSWQLAKFVKTIEAHQLSKAYIPSFQGRLPTEPYLRLQALRQIGRLQVDMNVFSQNRSMRFRNSFLHIMRQTPNIRTNYKHASQRIRTIFS